MSNTITFQARLGKDPVTRDVGDTTVTDLWVAESEKYKDKSGETVERTNWWSCSVWGKRGEAVARYMKKGDGILIRGSIRQTKKEKDGAEVTYYSVNVDDWEFPMSKKAGDGEPNRRSPSDQDGGF